MHKNKLKEINSNIQVNDTLTTKYKLDKLLLGCNELTNVDILFPVIEKVGEIKEENMFITKFTKLTVVDLKQNKLNKVPLGCLLLKELKVLDLTNNQIDNLPCFLGYMKNLNILKVEGNKLRKIRGEVLSSGGYKLKEYLRNKDISYGVNLYSIFKSNLNQNSLKEREKQKEKEENEKVVEIETESNSKRLSIKTKDIIEELKFTSVEPMKLKVKEEVKLEIKEKIDVNKEIELLVKELEENYNMNKFKEKKLKLKLTKLRKLV